MQEHFRHHEIGSEMCDSLFGGVCLGLLSLDLTDLCLRYLTSFDCTDRGAVGGLSGVAGSCLCNSVGDLGGRRALKVRAVWEDFDVS